MDMGYYDPQSLFNNPYTFVKGYLHQKWHDAKLQINKNTCIMNGTVHIM